jgi:hypothetical protein
MPTNQQRLLQTSRIIELAANDLRKSTEGVQVSTGQLSNREASPKSSRVGDSRVASRRGGVVMSLLADETRFEFFDSGGPQRTFCVLPETCQKWLITS